MSAAELDAARLVRAGLEILRDALPDDSRPMTLALAFLEEIGRLADNLEQDAPPWKPEPAAPVEIPWSQVACGDEVQAPNGQWYPVDSIARLGGGVVALLKLPAGGTTKTTRDAGDKVPTRRGATGQAMDLFRAGGLEPELIKSGVAA